MKFLTNILWIIFGGLLLFVLWGLAGILLCLTIIGAPMGIQCFKIAYLMFAPFGKEIVYSSGTISFLVNVLWLALFGWELALTFLWVGLLWCITIVGVPIGLQCFKFSKLALMPFGAKVV